jgi:ParB-like chromosome segregation protein Spo0J
MTSSDFEARDLSPAQPGGPSDHAPATEVREPTRTGDTRMSPPQRVEIAQIDVRFDKLRLPSPQQTHRLLASVQSEGRIREPLLVSTGVEEKCSVLVDGFKRLRVAQDLGLTHVWVQTMQLDATHAKAAILLYNQAREGLCEIEEAWIVHSLHCEHGLQQIKIAELLKRHSSWVCRRLQLVEKLEESLQKDVRLGLLSASMARELGQLPRGKQLEAAQAVQDHQLSSRQCARLVKRLKEASPSEPKAMQEVLEDPLRYIAAGSSPTPKRAIGDDPRLSEAGNELRQALLRWQDACSALERQLRKGPPSATEAPVLLSVLQKTERAGKRALKQVAAIHKACSEQPPAPPSEPPPAQEASDA